VDLRCVYTVPLGIIQPYEMAMVDLRCVCIENSASVASFSHFLEGLADLRCVCMNTVPLDIL
jgi:hypothetical protein